MPNLRGTNMQRLILAALWSLLSSAALAKLPTVEVTLSGPMLEATLHSRNPAVIAPNVWMGNFALLDDGAVPAPPAAAPRLTAYFWINDHGTHRIAYTVDLVYDIEGRSALVYLPGKRDPRFNNNTRTILRKGQDGRWFRAEPTWAAAVNEALATAQVRAEDRFDASEFRRLMQRLATAWNEGDARAAADCFAKNAVYSQPPGKQLYRGRAALYEYFGGDAGRAGAMSMRWHKLAFDPASQTGIGEFSFKYGTFAHGIAVVRIENGKISRWREYYVESTAPWHEFTKDNVF